MGIQKFTEEPLYLYIYWRTVSVFFGWAKYDHIACSAHPQNTKLTTWGDFDMRSFKKILGGLLLLLALALGMASCGGSGSGGAAGATGTGSSLSGSGI